MLKFLPSSPSSPIVEFGAKLLLDTLVPFESESMAETELLMEVD